MTESKLSIFLQDEFQQLCRKMTYATVIAVCIFAVVAWWFGIEVKGNMATLIGLIFIILAVLTFKIPHIAYRYMLNKYKHEPEKLSALGSSWKEFKDSSQQRY